MSTRDRVKELLEHNNAQLEENRAQRREIERLKLAVDWLVTMRKFDHDAAEDRQKLLDALSGVTR